jgi:2-amino-4-hydroxy-6-hydroxymethyldihydropteridine diphosphokinase
VKAAARARRAPVRAIIGFGGNVGDAAASCRQAIQILGMHPEIVVLRCSSLYRTEPVGKMDQDWFVNGVALCETSLEAEQLLGVLQGIEEDFGRTRRERWGPRTLDLDILSFADRVLDTEGLTLPHPRLHERKFVLVPLMEIHPHWTHPRLRRTVSGLLRDLEDQGGQAVDPLEPR